MSSDSLTRGEEADVGGTASDAKSVRLSLYRRDDVRRFFEWALKGDGEIRPQRNPETSEYVYPGFPTAETGSPPRLLSELESHEILEKYVLDEVPACPACGHYDFNVSYVCPFSQHRLLERGTMIEHFACGYTDFELKFKAGYDLVCPKCRKTLKLVGTDYRKMDRNYRCSGCGRLLSTPKIELDCRMCSKVLQTDDALMKPIYAYRINERLRAELVAHCALETQIANLFRDHGFDVEMPKTIAGQSGLEHSFDISAQGDGSQILLDLISAPDEIGTETVAAFFAKIYDTKPRRAILVGLPRFSAEAQKLGAMYLIEMVAAAGADQVVEKLSLMLALPEDKRNIQPDRENADEILRLARSKTARITELVDRRLTE